MFACDFTAPQWCRPPWSFTFHTIARQIYTQVQIHIRCFVCMSLAWFSQQHGVTALRLSQDPCRQPWDKKLIITQCTPRWMAGGHAVMRTEGRKGGNKLEAYCEDGQISTSATAATQTKTHPHARTQLRKLHRRAVLSAVITLLPLWHEEIGAIWTPL